MCRSRWESRPHLDAVLGASSGSCFFGRACWCLILGKAQGSRMSSVGVPAMLVGLLGKGEAHAPQCLFLLRNHQRTGLMGAGRAPEIGVLLMERVRLEVRMASPRVSDKVWMWASSPCWPREPPSAVAVPEVSELLVTSGDTL